MSTLRLIAALCVVASVLPMASATDYTKGVFIVNEDWYGHQNSSVNHLDPDASDGEFWTYRVIRNENPGMELGCTNQFGAIWDGRFYLIAKQDKDPGASVAGGRVTVADAATMKIIRQLPLIDPSGRECDGRGFVGVDSHKGYISTSNGVWILDLDRLEVTGQVKGTENPSGPGSGNNHDSGGSLYHGQCGSMVAACGRVFVAHQQYGLLVVDPSLDEVTDVVAMDQAGENAGIGSVVLSRDGMLWVSVAKDTQGLGAALPVLVRVDPSTLEAATVDLDGAGVYPPSNSWYAWTPDSFCASTRSNALYWSGGRNTWFSGQYIFRMDLDSGNVERIIDLEADGEDWRLYGCSMRVHPLTDEIYMSLYHEFGQPVYVTRRYTSGGVKLRDYDMVQNYWFPSLPVFSEGDSGAGLGSVGADAPEASVEMTSAGLRLRSLEGVAVEVYDLSGSVVARITPSAPDEVVDPGLPRGVYIVRAGAVTQKIYNFAR